MQFVAWNAGTFTIDAEDPLAAELWDNREMNYRITVLSTDEIVWWVDRMDRTRDGELIVTCRPHVDVMRDFTAPDWKMVGLWLAAEKRWKSEQSNNLRTRLTDLIYGTVSWRDVNVPVAEEAADAVIRELKLERRSGWTEDGHKWTADE